MRTIWDFRFRISDLFKRYRTEAGMRNAEIKSEDRRQNSEIR
jgi:hypothetical protein